MKCPFCKSNNGQALNSCPIKYALAVKEYAGNAPAVGKRHAIFERPEKIPINCGC